MIVTRALLLVTMLGSCTVPVAHAAVYYLAPTGTMSNPGSRQLPLASLEIVAASGRTFAAGDELVLLAGHHGSPNLRGQNAGRVLIRPDTGARVTLKRLTLTNASRWTVRGLEISPSLQNPYERVSLLTVSGGSENFIESCSLYSVADTSGWSATDWNTLACHGVGLTGNGHVVRDNTIRNVSFGISVNPTGVACRVLANVIENISGDGIRGVGDYGVFEGNTVRNCYKVNANHDDAFQSWSTGSGGPGTGVIRGVVVRGNTFISYTDPAQPFRGEFQGIGCFDGIFEDWVVENNVVITNAWHGIAFYGARSCRIVNNTVIDRDTAVAGVPWIKITAHKNGTASADNLVRNNLASDVRIDAGMATADHNLKTTDYARNFVNWAALDLRLAATSPAIDAGIATSAPALDITGASRPVDGNNDGTAAWDLGAYEFDGTAPVAPTGLQVSGQ